MLHSLVTARMAGLTTLARAVPHAFTPLNTDLDNQALVGPQTMGP